MQLGNRKLTLDFERAGSKAGRGLYTVRIRVHVVLDHRLESPPDSNRNHPVVVVVAFRRKQRVPIVMALRILN
jgi:hypothetical protein